MEARLQRDLDQARHRKSAVALLSVISNTCLVILKLIVGLMIGSVSVISEAIHSGVDLLAAIIAFWAVKTSGKPADENHSFGHGKFENMSGTVEALLIFLAAGWIIYEAVHRLLNVAPLETPGWGMAVMLISALVNYVISQKLMKVGNATGSVALQADAWHLRTDVYTSAGVMVGLAIIWLGQFVLPGIDLRWVDPVAAIVVALLIVKAAYVLTIESGRDLLDASLPPMEEAVVREQVAAFSPVVGDIHRMRTRKSGHTRFVEFHMRVDPNMSVKKAHELNHAVADAISQRLPDTKVTIHIEPFAEELQPAEMDRSPR